VFSPIDNKPMEGIPSIRVHNGKDYVNGSRLIRWTEVFIVQNEGEASRNQDPIDISKVSETIAKATCTALVKYLDLLVSNSFYKIGIRANLNAMFVAYSAGSNATKLPPIYMESLDNELVPVLHRNATSDCDENTIILELIFRILNK
jgi:MAD (mothers against decapentaplegic) interacting protein